VRQFLGALLPSDEPVLPADAVALLSPAERALYSRLTSPYRRHTLAVYRRLRASGTEDADLLTAALLHDVGKAEARIRLYHRVLGVLLRNLALPLLLWLAREDTLDGWRYPFYVQRHHAKIGARLVAAAGSPAPVAALVAHHHEAPSLTDDDNLRALRNADGAE
jgi:putative nucleotidyltransferase with HDIG domain